MLGLGMLGNNPKSTTVIVGAKGMRGGKEYEEKYGEGKEMEEIDILNPIEMMMEGFIKAIDQKDSKRAAKILSFIIEIERKKGGTEIEIKS